MKSNFNLKHGTAKIIPENSDDLWILNSILQEGDLVKARTPRSQDIMRDGKRIRGPKRMVVLKIRIEKKEMDRSLKLRGKIVEGPEDVERGYHTIEVSPNTPITIQRDWKKWEIDKVKSAAKKTEPVLVAILDERECDFYEVGNKVKHILHIDGPGTGKGSEEPRKREYIGKIVSALGRRKDKNIVIAGPGFARESVVREAEDRLAGKKIILEGCSHTGMSGLQEVLKRKVLDRVVKNSRITEETEIVERFFEELAKKGKVTYGKKQVERAIEVGAVDTLLITEDLVRENENILEKAGKIGSKVVIISTEHQSGKKFSGIGGIAAFLRYRVE